MLLQRHVTSLGSTYSVAQKNDLLDRRRKLEARITTYEHRISLIISDSSLSCSFHSKSDIRVIFTSIYTQWYCGLVDAHGMWCKRHLYVHLCLLLHIFISYC